MHDLKPKAAYLAAKTLSSTLAGYSIGKRLDLNSDEDFAFELTKGKDHAIAVWTTAKEHQVKLPISPGKGTLVDMLGKKRELSWKTNGLRLKMSQSPQYILIYRN